MAFIDRPLSKSKNKLSGIFRATTAMLTSSSDLYHMGILRS